MVLVNGMAHGTLGPDDRGLNYGDGLFETCAVRDGRPLLWERHLERLYRGCRQIRIPPPPPEVLTAEVNDLARHHERAVVKLLLTRGPGGRGYRPPARPEPTRVVSLHPWPEAAAGRARDGIRVRLCSTPVSANPALARIKHTARLENVLARGEWQADDPVEGLMLDAAGDLVEGTASNVFMVEEGMLVTPALEQAGVAGIMRELLLEAATEAGIPVAVEALALARLRLAAEVFVTNSVAGIWPVVWLDGSELTIGPLTRRLQGLLEKRRAVAYTL